MKTRPEQVIKLTQTVDEECKLIEMYALILVTNKLNKHTNEQ